MNLKKDWFEVVKEVILHPKDFFKNMPKSGKDIDMLTADKDVIIFAAINFTIIGILNTLIGLIIKTHTIYYSFLDLIGIVVGGIIRLFIIAAVLHILLRLFGAKKDYETTFRVLAYLSSFVLLLWIPIVKVLISIYLVYVEILAFATVHRMTIKRAAFAVLLIPVSLTIVLIWIYIQMFGVQLEIVSEIADILL